MKSAMHRMPVLTTALITLIFVISACAAPAPAPAPQVIEKPFTKRRWWRSRW